MTSTELKDLIARIKFDLPSAAACLGIPYHTLRNYVYGENAIPANIERAALELEQVNISFTRESTARIDAAIKKQFPHGVPNEAAYEQ